MLVDNLRVGPLTSDCQVNQREDQIQADGVYLTLDVPQLLQISDFDIFLI